MKRVLRGLPYLLLGLSVFAGFLLAWHGVIDLNARWAYFVLGMYGALAIVGASYVIGEALEW